MSGYSKNFEQAAEERHRLHLERTTEEKFLRAHKKLVSAPTLSFYDSRKEMVLSLNASSFGLGGVLLQRHEKKNYEASSIMFKVADAD